MVIASPIVARGRTIFRETFAVVFWIGLFTKLILWDWDYYLLSTYAPCCLTLLRYKFIFILSGYVLAWLLLGGRRVFRLTMFVLWYPIIVPIRFGIYLLLNHWSYLILLTPVIYNVFSRFRWFVIRRTLAILSIVCILVSQTSCLLILSMLILGVLFATHLVHCIRRVYTPGVFAKLTTLAAKLRKRLQNTAFIASFVPPETPDNAKTAEAPESSAGSMILYIVHFTLDLAGNRVKDFVTNRRMDLYLVLSWMRTLTIAVLTFSFIYYSLFKITPFAFQGAQHFSYWSFLAFSLGKIAPTSLSTLIPVTTAATLLSWAQITSAMFLYIILVFVLLTAGRERHKEDVDSLVAELKQCAELIDESFPAILRMARSDAERLLYAKHSTTVNTMRRLRGLPAFSMPIEVSPIRESKCVEAISDTVATPSIKPPRPS